MTQREGSTSGGRAWPTSKPGWHRNHAREHYAAEAAPIECWLDQEAATGNVLVMDAPTFRLWARLMHRPDTLLYQDTMISATAGAHDVTVATCNLADFEPSGVRVFDPFGFAAGAG